MNNVPVISIEDHIQEIIKLEMKTNIKLHDCDIWGKIIYNDGVFDTIRCSVCGTTWTEASSLDDDLF